MDSDTTVTILKSDSIDTISKYYLPLGDLW